MIDEMVLTIIARDRPGLVKVLSETIAEHGGNWIDSSMATGWAASSPASSA